MDGRAKHRLISRVLLVSVVACAGLVVGAPIAMADPCPPLDLGCTLESTTTTVGETVEDTTTTAGEVLDETTTTAGEVLEDTTTTAGEVLEETTTTAGEVLEETTTTAGGVLEGGAGPIVGGVLPPDGPEVLPGTGDPSPGGGSAPDQPPPPGGGVSGGGEGTHVGSPATGTGAGPRALLVAPGSDPATAIGTGSAAIVGRAHVRFIDDGSAPSFDGATLARTLAFPVLLILLVIGFILVQNTIDRKDPKLALAPVGADHLPFS